eukprot:Skav223646  [mRNA]  locus=scaffold46:645614:649527:- [translate_table: standard]
MPMESLEHFSAGLLPGCPAIYGTGPRTRVFFKEHQTVAEAHRAPMALFALPQDEKSEDTVAVKKIEPQQSAFNDITFERCAS